MIKNRISKTVLATVIAELCVTAYAGAQTTNEQPAGGEVQQVVVSGIRKAGTTKRYTRAYYVWMFTPTR